MFKVQTCDGVVVMMGSGGSVFVVVFEAQASD